MTFTPPLALAEKRGEVLWGAMMRADL